MFAYTMPAKPKNERLTIPAAIKVMGSPFKNSIITPCFLEMLFFVIITYIMCFCKHYKILACLMVLVYNN